MKSRCTSSRPTPGIRHLNIKPQVDRYTFPSGNSLYLLAEGRLVNLAAPRAIPAL